ncbi:GNAT family N-acetyltransferase [Streptomyces sp. CA-251387]|uniref:GNAT family N-acetyltransferase n=1 Tax=Streptomyces sp. CA-251387 TaxID=3240064 RepID=UPI003D8B8EFB
MNPLATLSATEITTDRLRLRKAHDADIDGLIELQTDSQVRAHLGGPRPRRVVEQYFDTSGISAIAGKPGTYVIADKETDRFACRRQLIAACRSLCVTPTRSLTPQPYDTVLDARQRGTRLAQETGCEQNPQGP